MKQRLFIFVILILLGGTYSIGVSSVDAARFFFSGSTHVGIGGVRTVDVFLDTEGQQVNALEGTVVLDGAAAKIIDVYTGGSILSFWLNDRAHTSRQVPFTGIIPGGYLGTGFVLSLAVEGVEDGDVTVSFEDLRVLLHDGQGTETGVRGEKVSVTTVEQLSGNPIVYTDVTPPEWFEPIVIKSQEVFDNQSALIFAAQDKGFGISHYEVQESRDGALHPEEWDQATSPYLLNDQQRRSTIYVKAVDRAGNIRIVAIAASPIGRAVLLYWILPLAAFVIIILLLLIRKRRRYQKNGTIGVYDGGTSEEK